MNNNEKKILVNSGKIFFTKMVALYLTIFLLPNSQWKLAKYLQQINLGTKASSSKKYGKNELNQSTGFMTHYNFPHVSIR